MNFSFLQPKHALQRANELVLVQQETEAFELLSKTISDRKFRYVQWDSNIQQNVLIKYLELAVTLDKLKLCREGLLHFRNHCQHGVELFVPLENVIVYFRQFVENRIDETAEPSEIRRNINVCIEVYKLIIDVIKTTPKIYKVYHTTVQKAYELCRKYELKNDFKRFCEIFRSHYATISKIKLKNSDTEALKHIENLKKSDLHIETKLIQLSVAADLESWKELRQALVELGLLGISNFIGLGAFSGSSSKLLYLLAIESYFGYLAEYFRKSKYHILHAAALLKCFLHIKGQKKILPDDHKAAAASIVVLACLAVPEEVRSSCRESIVDEMFERQQASLLSSNTVPNKSQLLRLLIDKKIVNSAYEPVCQLFKLLESDHTSHFHLTSQVNEALAQINFLFNSVDEFKNCNILRFSHDDRNDLLNQYFYNIKVSALRKTVLLCSEVYDTLKIESFKEQICPESFLPWRIAERELLMTEKPLDIEISIDSHKGILRLNSKYAFDLLKSTYRSITHISSKLLQIILTRAEEENLKKRDQVNKAIRLQAVEESREFSERKIIMLKKCKEVEAFYRKLYKRHNDKLKEKAKRFEEAEATKSIQIANEIEEGKKKRDMETAALQYATIILAKMCAVVESVGLNTKTFKLHGLSLSEITSHHLLTQTITYKTFLSTLQAYVQKDIDHQLDLARQQYKKIEHYARAIKLNKIQNLCNLEKNFKSSSEELIENAQNNLKEIRQMLIERHDIIENERPKILEWLERRNSV